MEENLDLSLASAQLVPPETILQGESSNNHPNAIYESTRRDEGDNLLVAPEVNLIPFSLFFYFFYIMKILSLNVRGVMQTLVCF